MVKAINFAVRNSAGGVVQGTAGGEGSNIIQIGSGEQVSLNLSQASVLGYERKGDNLIVKLADGNTIVLDGFYDVSPAHVNKLYLSSDGGVTEVLLQDNGADGVGGRRTRHSGIRARGPGEKGLDYIAHPSKTTPTWPKTKPCTPATTAAAPAPSGWANARTAAPGTRWWSRWPRPPRRPRRTGLPPWPARPR